ncbi:hypothetical protein M0R04_00500 [Candidatus Dojkabacteria bacterium]|jgi:hypothetical protein|nr:hypothetical protein [Candidatus Dojkabacteria bacterium]
MKKTNNIIKNSVKFKKNIPRIKRKKKFFLFKKRPKHTTYKAVRNIKQKKALTRFILLILALILLIGIFFGTYFAIKAVNSLRQKAQTDNILNENVYGFDDIPAFPYSEFIFKGQLENDTVKTFLSKGNCVYRLLDEHTIDEVFTYYKDLLPENGWELKLAVPISSQEQMFGQYWVKNEKGLRIYSRLNDIWYQTVTVAQATNGLSDLVMQETARKLLLLTTDRVNLLPDFPWSLSFPSDYITKYYGTNISSFQGVSFKKIGSNSIEYIEPIGYNGAISYDAFINKYLAAYNKKNKTNWQVINSKEMDIAGDTGVIANITNGDKQSNIAVINNQSNSVVYIISTFTNNDPFFDYILTNIKSVAKPT